MSDSNNTFTSEDFTPVTESGRQTQTSGLSRPSMGFGKETVIILLHNKTAVASGAILLFLILGAILFPMICPYDYASQNVAFSNKPFFSLDPIRGSIHIFGTDHLGRDIFARVWYGARVSLLVAGAAAAIDGFIGVLYGSISGYVGGKADTVMMRVIEVISGIPYLVIVLLLMAVLPQGIGTLILAYTLVGWTSMARLIRGQVQSLNNREFMIAAKIMGSSMRRVIFRHLIPNTMSVIIVNITLDVPGIIFTEAFLSMLGMGVPAPYPSLGVMANEGMAVFQTYPIRLLVPALLICLIMLTFNLLGDKLQDALNPKLRRKAVYGKRAKNKRLKSVL